jgi:aconitate hydratase
MVTEYLTETGLLPYLEKLGFALAGYGCTTCIGNAGDLTPELNEAITRNDLVCAAVLSGNRNFEARIHPNIKANFLASPPLVVAYAIAGTVRKDLMTEPVGKGKGGKDVYLGDIWPSSEEIQALLKYAMNGKAFRATTRGPASRASCGKRSGRDRATYTWPQSTYIAEPPFFRLHSAGAAAAAQADPIRRCTARASWRCSATPSPPTISRPQAPSRKARPPASGCWPMACKKPTSTAMARAAATTR